MERQLATPGIDVRDIMSRVRKRMHTGEVLERGGGFADIRQAGDIDAAKREIPLALVDHVAIAGPLSKVRHRLAELASAGVTDVFIDVETLPAADRDLPALMAELGLA
jgi:hypothetical protein